jgi:hypothetical protein
MLRQHVDPHATGNVHTRRYLGKVA